ncbi:hypothetical protein TrVGV298_011814 [Trichoderma virens]|nr:hypothetical protein TrVGV298_011814 [Trichoderma virens]
MIWYLLYPLRGTTEAPVLSASHPLRRVLTRYGRHASRYAITTLLISVAVASFLIYPLPFIYTSHVINGASTLPRHVWTAAQPLPYDSTASPDIVMRSIWVHSSYMQALSHDILLSALDLQDELLGDTRDFGPSRSFGLLPPPSWIFHSPLLYWNCSRERILADDDILATVNARKNHTTPANITLRHSIVFSGKRFEDRRLLAADALVITLLYRTDSPVGRQWEAVAPSLPLKVGDKWDIYPPSGHVSASQLYEFQFRPMSVQDSIILALAYTLSLLYFLQQVSKVRAVKSKLGLIVTVMTQIIMSIAASFTICGVFQIDLSRIPRAAYPLVILSMSLEHILRLMDAVVRTPSGESTSSRIGSAFGETAPTALVSTVQNFLILLGLSYVVTPSVSAFCIFAAIAIVLDFLFLSSFFISVLSVDVRRMELGDALAKEAMRRKRKARRVRENPSWVKRMLEGKIALSTRIAGTIVMISFIIIAQSHFFGGGDISQRLAHLYNGQDLEPNVSSPEASPLEDIHQARTPTSWLRLQDHDAAREIIRLIKPSAYSYIARVYEPYLALVSGDCVLHTFSPQDDDDAISLQSVNDVGASSGWCSWADAKERKKHIGNPGVWSILSDGSALGLRRRPRTEPRSRHRHHPQAMSGMRNRMASTQSQEFGAFSCWELWRAASSDWEEVDETVPLFGSDEDAGQLIVCDLGPSVRVGPTSVAFAYGNIIKLATLSGHKPFETGIDEVSRESPMNVPARRRKMGTTARSGPLS